MKQNIIIAVVFIIALLGIYFISDNSVSAPSKDIQNQTGKEIENNKDQLADINVQTNQISSSSAMAVASATMVEADTKAKIINKNKTMQTIIMKTNKGDITLELNAAITPNTVANFVKLANDKFYDGVKFHRVIKGFMIQSGDPNSKNDNAKNTWGMGSPGYKFADEIVAGNSNVAGTISMANSGPNTNGSQFFINTVNNSFLDGKHTVFGKVVSGQDIVQAIEGVKTGEADRPADSVIIQSIIVQ
jgi:cyclophilin family peptidyl-prolyl cis-trans isomerase